MKDIEIEGIEQKEFILWATNRFREQRTIANSWSLQKIYEFPFD